MAPDPSARANGTERGCVEDQPQRVGSSKASGACSVLRLVEDDTAALRSMCNSGKADRGLMRDLVAGPREPGQFCLSTSAAGRNCFVSRIESGQPVQVEEEA